MSNSLKTMASEVLDRNSRIAALLVPLKMAVQLAESGGHDGESENCPTCHFLKEAYKALQTNQ